MPSLLGSESQRRDRRRLLSLAVDDASDTGIRGVSWKASFEGLLTDAGDDVSSPDDVASLLAASADRQSALSSEIAQLQEQVLRITEEHRQQSAMQQAIIDGLESQCDNLSEENANIHDELTEKRDSICTLEEATKRLQTSLDTLKSECEEKCHQLSNLQKAKMEYETLSHDVTSAVSKLAAITALHAAKLEGFPSQLPPPTTWSNEVEYIAQFVEQASMLIQKYMLELERATESRPQQVTAESATPKAKGSDGGSAPAMNFVAQHADMLEELKTMKTALTNAMSSPKLTPTKRGRTEEGTSQKNNEFDAQLYSDLLKAHEQLGSLSEKIAAFRVDQMEWEHREVRFQSRIAELEEENKVMRLTPTALSDVDQSKLKEAGAVMMGNFDKRHQRAAMQQAFQTWSSQTRTSQHLGIAMEMARELAQTRKKVLMLKAHLDG
ncbi:hypothetical protein ACHAXT_009462 [Thalassiosira profunda]